MTGTSCDGVDVAIVEIRGRGLAMSVQLLHHVAAPYPPTLRNRILEIRNSRQSSLGELATLAFEISEQYAYAINRALTDLHLSPDQVAAIAAHGQTLFHSPPHTIQWLDPSLLAARTNIDVVSDFRRADCAAGGQGAPLVPFADFILFGQTSKPRVMLNIGGIANITCLPTSGRAEEIIAFDTGPGNCIMDHLMRQARLEVGGPGYDEDGRIARTGKIHSSIVEQFLASEYVAKPWPKSTDGPARIVEFQKVAGDIALPLPDQLATACEITCQTIRQAILGSIAKMEGGRPRPPNPSRTPADGDIRPPVLMQPAEIIASGGGTQNSYLLERLRASFSDTPIIVSTTDQYHIPSSAKEALAFALLGAATLDRYPSNIPSATGATQAVVLGSVTPKP